MFARAGIASVSVARTACNLFQTIPSPRPIVMPSGGGAWGIHSADNGPLGAN